MDLRCTLKVGDLGNQNRARICIIKHKGLFKMASLSNTKEQTMAKILLCK